MILIDHWEGASYIEYIDWFLRCIINYWVILIDQQQWVYIPSSELAHKEHFMAKETCSHTSFFLQNVLTHISQFLQNKFQTFSLTPLFLHNINMADIFFKWKSLNMFTHTINLHNTLPHWSQKENFQMCSLFSKSVHFINTFISLKGITFIFKRNSSNMSFIIYLSSSKMHHVHFEKGNYSDTFDTAILWNKGVIENVWK